MLLAKAALRWRRGNDALWFLFACSFLAVAISQAVFIAYGENLRRSWELTEYKEAFIAFGFLVLSIEVLAGAKAARVGSTDET